MGPYPSSSGATSILSRLRTRYGTLLRYGISYARSIRCGLWSGAIWASATFMRHSLLGGVENWRQTNSLQSFESVKSGCDAFQVTLESAHCRVLRAATFHFPFHTGLRFSLNALRASRLSSLSKAKETASKAVAGT